MCYEDDEDDDDRYAGSAEWDDLEEDILGCRLCGVCDDCIEATRLYFEAEADEASQPPDTTGGKKDARRRRLDA